MLLVAFGTITADRCRTMCASCKVVGRKDCNKTMKEKERGSTVTAGLSLISIMRGTELLEWTRHKMLKKLV